MKPKIVILSAFLAPLRSGAEACAEEVPLALADRYDFTIVTARMRRDLPKKDLLQGRILVIRVGFGSSFDKWLFPFLAPFKVRQLKPDIVHAVLESFAGLAMIFCPGKKVLTCQSTNTSFLVGKMHKAADMATAISRVLIERAQKFGRGDVVHIPNGIPVAAIIESQLRNQKVPGRILFVGRLEPMKGVDTLLEAFARVVGLTVETPLPAGSVQSVGGNGVSTMGSNTNTHLRIVGDGSERTRLEQMAQDLGIADRVTFVGYVQTPDVYKEYAEAEIFCGLSRSEALGNVFLEAQAAGCVVIGTRVGGIPDIVEDGRNGLLVPPDDVEAAAAALEKLLSNSALRNQLAENGKKNALQYDWSGIAERYASVYEDIM